MPRVLTDPYIQKLAPAGVGKRYAAADALVPGLKVRVTDRGTKTFIVWRRFGGAKNASARAIGVSGVISLAEAREKAREWVLIAKRGEDPAEIERARRAAEAERRGQTFGAVMETYLKHHVSKHRRAKQSEAEIRRDLLPRWKDKPLAAISRRDVVYMADEIVARGAPYSAHIALAHARAFFNWVIDRGIYGLETAPTDRLRPKRIIGPKAVRQRVLNDTEIFTLWRAAMRTPYPMGPLIRLLVLTGQRRSEVAEAHWSEIDFRKRLWTIPPERFKSDATHLVPLSDEAISLLQELPRWTVGDCLFSTNNGLKPVNSFGKAKSRLERRMLRTLNALAHRSGENTVKLEHFVFHDLRRTVRTRLSGLRVPYEVAEMVIGHGKRGLGRVYDQHEYADEMREALEKWADALRTIIDDCP